MPRLAFKRHAQNQWVRNYPVEWVNGDGHVVGAGVIRRGIMSTLCNFATRTGAELAESICQAQQATHWTLTAVLTSQF